MNKYKCKVCGYIYDPAQNSNTDFQDLPEDYHCPVCGAEKSKFEVIHQKGEEYTGGEAQEKHVPVIKVEGKTVTVKIGLVPHPMIKEHHIAKVELYDGANLIKSINLTPEQEPKTIFENVQNANNLRALAYCNLHGIWES